MSDSFKTNLQDGSHRASLMKVHKEKISQLRLILNDTVASTIAGVIGIAATHPIDTIRIRMQLQGTNLLEKSSQPSYYKTSFH